MHYHPIREFERTGIPVASRVDGLEGCGTSPALWSPQDLADVIRAHQVMPREHTEGAPEPRPVPTDPRHDSRPDPARLFSRDFVDVPDEVRARCIRGRAVVSTGLLYDAWAGTDWHEMRLLPLVGASCILVQRRDFLEALPHLGTARVAYHAEKNWVCREYGFVFAVIVAAELECNAGIVCDDAGHHLYSFVPVLADGQVECLIVEPQADRVVPHTDPSAHYVGKTGFALLI